jgi:hypothetical protein
MLPSKQNASNETNETETPADRQARLDALLCDANELAFEMIQRNEYPGFEVDVLHSLTGYWHAALQLREDPAPAVRIVGPMLDGLRSTALSVQSAQVAIGRDMKALHELLAAHSAEQAK